MSNPSKHQWPCFSEEFVNKNVDLGQFKISEKQVERLNEFTEMPLHEIKDDISSVST